MNAAGTETYFDKPEVIEALQYWVDLGRKHKVMPLGVIEWGTTPKDFFEKKIAMMWTTTGNLTNVKNNAKFDFGVAMLPANKRRGSPTGGGNFYVFKKAPKDQQVAAVKLAKFMTQPERAAQWGIDTGYVAVAPTRARRPVMKEYVKGFPVAAVARDQLQYSVAELSTHENQRVTKALNDGLQAALTGAKEPAQAMKDAQAEAARILRSYKRWATGPGREPGNHPAIRLGLRVGDAGGARASFPSDPPAMRPALRPAIHGWLLLLPAFALLALFTHWPIVGTVWDSFFSTPKGGRPAAFVGLENYHVMVADEVFWRSLWNNLWFALGTIPLSIGLALVMAIWVNGAMRGRTWLRMAFFTPTVLPMIAVANIWLFFYTPQYGLLEQFTRLFGVAERNWLGSESTALACVMVVAIWKEAGFFMIFYLAALQQIPPSLAEAAALEGAPRAYYFRRIVLPLLMPTTLFVLVNAVINSVRLVDHIVVMTKGGPQQRHLPAALPHLPGGLQLLGHGLRGRAHRGAAGHPRAGGDRAVRVPRQARALPMNARARP